MENKALGKGLSALLSKTSQENMPDTAGAVQDQGQRDAVYIKTMSILDNKLQPRQNYDEAKLEELKASIKEKGVLQPILVRKSAGGYEVVAGERRLKAARALGLEEVPVIIKNGTDREALVLALIENIQREDLNAIEEAVGFKRLIEEFQLTQEAVADAVGKDRSTVTNLLRLLRLPTEIQKQIIEAKLSMGHARALLSLESAAVQKKMAQVIVSKGLSVRQVEDLVKKAQKGQETAPSAAAKAGSRDIEILEEELRKILGTRVLIKDRKGKGKLVIEYYNLDDLDRILGVLRK